MEMDGKVAVCAEIYRFAEKEVFAMMSGIQKMEMELEGGADDEL